MDMTMRFSDWASLFGLVAGPTIAVVITLVWTNWTEARRRKSSVLQQLLVSRGLPADLNFNQAINRVPVEFKEASVIEAWNEYINAANKQAADNSHLNDLIRAMMKVLGYKVEQAGGVVRGAYMSTAFGQHVELQVNSMKAMVRIADASEKSAAAAQKMVDGLGRGRDEAA